MWRWLLVFIVGVLVGANATYFVLSRGGVDRRVAAAPAPPVSTDPGAAAAPPPQDAPTRPPTPSAPVPAIVRAVPAPSGLVIPVQGVTAGQLVNTFDQARGEGRVHEAIDIMAPTGTPVLAVADGWVEKLFTSDQGGLTIYQFEPTRTWSYYYAHLDRYADGLREGQPLKRGQVIGYVGYSGNANPEGPHLHFAINVLDADKRWHGGTPINPYPLLGGMEQVAAATP